MTEETIVYSEEYDAHYNPRKNEWLDDTCDDPECSFCVGRPERPLDDREELERSERDR
jgi:hypothetical protein